MMVTVMVMIRRMMLRMLMKSTWVAGPPPPLSPTRNCFPSSHCHCILGLEWRLFILCWWWCQCTNHNVQTCNILGWVWVGIILKRGELASPAGWRQWWCWWWEIFHLVANWAPLCCLGSPPVGSLSSSSSSDEEKPLRRLILEPPRTSRKSWNPSSTEALWRRRGVEAPQVTATNGLSFQPRSRLSFSQSHSSFLSHRVLLWEYFGLVFVFLYFVSLLLHSWILDIPVIPSQGSHHLFCSY